MTGHGDATSGEDEATADESNQPVATVAPNVRITGRAFGNDRRVPIAQAWRPRFVVTGEVANAGTGETGPAEEGPASGTDAPLAHEPV